MEVRALPTRLDPLRGEAKIDVMAAYALPGFARKLGEGVRRERRDQEREREQELGHLTNLTGTMGGGKWPGTGSAALAADSLLRPGACSEEGLSD